VVCHVLTSLFLRVCKQVKFTSIHSLKGLIDQNAPLSRGCNSLSRFSSIILMDLAFRKTCRSHHGTNHQRFQFPVASNVRNCLSEAEIWLCQLCSQDSISLVHRYGVESHDSGADRKNDEKQGKSEKIGGKSAILGANFAHVTG
jgi:hypothetical protein